MGTFVTEPTTELFQPKVGKTTLPPGIDPRTVAIADDFNALRGAAYDLREAVRAVSNPTTMPYDLVVFIQGVMQNNEVLGRFTFTRNVTFAAGLSTSRATAALGGTGSTTIALQKNGVAIGSITFGVGATTGSFTFAQNVSFQAGDVLTLKAPASADTTLSDVSVTLSGARANP